MHGACTIYARVGLLKNPAFEEVSLAGGGQKTAAFQEINPLGQVPVLIDGATTIRDSGAPNVCPG